MAKNAKKTNKRLSREPSGESMSSIMDVSRRLENGIVLKMVFQRKKPERRIFTVKPETGQLSWGLGGNYARDGSESVCK